MNWIGYCGIGVAATATAAAGVIAHACFYPRSQLLTPVIWHGSLAEPARVALTFDDGPSPDSTPLILDALAELHVAAAFFVIGRNVERHADIIKRMDAEGHLVCGHTFHHPHMGLMSGQTYWDRELAMADDQLAALLGKRPAFFRPPMGFKNHFMARAVRRRGQVMVTWTRRALDGLPTTTERIVARLGPAAMAGDILALHDGAEPNVSRSQASTVAAIRPLVAALRGRGLQTVRLDKLIGRPGYLDAEPA